MDFSLSWCRYVRVLGAFYMRLTGTDIDVYRYLEPLYNDYRKLRQKLTDGSKFFNPFLLIFFWSLSHCNFLMYFVCCSYCLDEFTNLFSNSIWHKTILVILFCHVLRKGNFSITHLRNLYQVIGQGRQQLRPFMFYCHRNSSFWSVKSFCFSLCNFGFYFFEFYIFTSITVLWRFLGDP